VQLLKLDVPSDATPETPWRLTRVSRHTYFVSVPPQTDAVTEPAAAPLTERAGRELDYEPLAHPERTEPDSDIYALAVDRVVSIAPMSIDLTSRVDRGQMEALLRGPTNL
jgi:5'-nucleotidase